MTQKKNNLKWNLLFYTLSFVCFLVFSNTAKASVISPYVATSTIAYSVNGNITTIGCETGESGVLLLLTDDNYAAPYATTGATINSNSFVRLTGTTKSQVWYLYDYNIGELSFSIFSSEFSYATNAQFLEICGIKEEDAFEKFYLYEAPSWDSPFNVYATSTQETFSGLAITSQNNADYSINFSPLGTIFQSVRLTDTARLGFANFYNNDDTDVQMLHYWWTGGSMADFIDIVFNNGGSVAPPVTGWISPILENGNVSVEVCPNYAYGCSGDKLSDWTIQYNICDYWDYTSTFEIGMENSDHTNVNEYLESNLFPMPRLPAPSGCSGLFNYSQFYNPFVGYEEWHFFLRKTTATTTETIYFEDYAFEVATLPEIIYSNGFIYYTGEDPLIVNTSSGAGTSTINFQYNICDQENYLDHHFQLENLQTNALLDISTSTTDCSGVASLDLPHAKNFVNTLNARVDLVNASSSPAILGESFTIIWQITDAPPVQVCNLPSYNINDICEDIDTSTMLGDIRCGIKYALVSSAQFLFYPSCSSLLGLTDNYNDFKTSFPFNTYFDFTNSIDTAINTSLATTSANNISIPFIRQTATSSEYYMLPVMSTSTISNTIGDTGYNTLRTTLAYIYWVIGGVIIFLIITKI